MSGGSFDYLCFADSAGAILSRLDDLRRMEEWLRAYRLHSAADEIYVYLLELETHQRRIEAYTKRMYGLLHAVEWTVSGDTGIEAIHKAYGDLSGIANPPAIHPTEPEKPTT